MDVRRRLAPTVALLALGILVAPTGCGSGGEEPAGGCSWGSWAGAGGNCGAGGFDFYSGPAYEDTESTYRVQPSLAGPGALVHLALRIPVPLVYDSHWFAGLTLEVHGVDLVYAEQDPPWAGARAVELPPGFTQQVLADRLRILYAGGATPFPPAVDPERGHELVLVTDGPSRAVHALELDLLDAALEPKVRIHPDEG